MRNAARHPHQIPSMRLDPDAIELEVEHALLHQDEFVLCRMDVNRHELTGLAVGLEREGGVGDGFGEVELTEDVPGLAGIAGAGARDALFECDHAVSPSCTRMKDPAAAAMCLSRKRIPRRQLLIIIGFK